MHDHFAHAGGPCKRFLKRSGDRVEAFGVSVVDDLLKPIEAAQLERALEKIERLRGAAATPPAMAELIERLAAAARTAKAPAYPDRVASKVGERIEFVDLNQVTHFFAADKLTFAATPAKNYAVDYTIQERNRSSIPPNSSASIGPCRSCTPGSPAA